AQYLVEHIRACYSARGMQIVPERGDRGLERNSGQIRVDPAGIAGTEGQQSVAADKYCGVVHTIEGEREADGDRRADVVLVRQIGDDCPCRADVLEREAYRNGRRIDLAEHRPPLR